MIRVFLVDDHEIVRCGVADLIDDEHDLVVVGQASSAGEAMRRIPAVNPDIAVLDVRLPDGNGIELCRDLRSRCPDLNCLMLTSFTDEQAMLDAIMAGAGGYVIKDIKGMDLVSAIRTVGSGRSLLDNRAAAVLKSRLQATTASSPVAAERDAVAQVVGHLPSPPMGSQTKDDSAAILNAHLERHLEPWRRKYPDTHVEVHLLQGGLPKYLSQQGDSIQMAVIGRGRSGGLNELLRQQPATSYPGTGCTLMICGDNQRL
ncbi:response regulator transcription factor [Mycobacteroides abscessus]|uniref:response regulator n=1 Tax=Mycobacteroides abscessus TaxID=36809 RepID=UPI0039EFFCAC